ncbi:hypothetical protein L2E82_13707 [Cichorium intybus]|uniref:Uncharacterized protein n=1 Tax=Cichorium intybus TaxID=13427 RepID=A0ACB9EYR1_CICIN|nr:hypothetical protein L2E82_13707 [Cichorium intybus]
MNIEFEGRFGQAQRQKYDCLLFDLDDTLYPVSVGLAPGVLKNIKNYMVEKLGIAAENIPKLCNLLYKNYGTTMADIRAIGYDFDYDEYHSFVHGRFPYENLKPNPVLRSLLLNLPIRKVNDPPAGIRGAPVDNNIMLWNAVIFGPDDTPWDEDVVFPRPEELKARNEKRFGEMGKEVPGEALNEMLANFDLPKSKDMPRTDDYFDQVLIVGSLHLVDSTAFRIAAIAWDDEFTPLQNP